MTTEGTPETASDQGSIGATTAVFSMKEAANVAGVSVSTLRRRREDLIGAGADISADGWQVPMTALVACGLIAGEGPQREQPGGRPQVQPQEASDMSAQLEELTSQVRDLEREVSEWRRRAEVAEARAEERGRALDALQVANEAERMALRMLTAGTSPAQNPVHREQGRQEWHQEGPHDTYRETTMEGHQGRHSDVRPSQNGVNGEFRPSDEASEQAPNEQSEPKGFFRRMMGL
ncbi:hypothetical protein RF638_15450 [Kocuria sp. CPCC 205235]|uniref:hypothetical protein n=1 Tax=Kocuria sp. CPCC 205235 TaxID=3073549 RepID=UPI0034D3B29B